MPNAIVIRAYGDSDQLKFEDIAQPEPAEGEILVRQTAVGVNYHDVYVRSGLYKTLDLPGIPGCEAVGVVESVGESVKGLKPGDRIAYVTGGYGAYASHRTLAATLAVPIPDDVSDETAASNLLRAMTVDMLTAYVHPIKPGITVLVHAAAGGVGRMLCQSAANMGAVVIGTVGTEAKAGIAKSNGCNHTIKYREVDFVQSLAELTDGTGVDIVYDSVGADTFAGSIQSLALCGHLVNFGQSSGAVDPITMGTLATKSLTVSRPILFHYLQNSNQYRRMAQKAMHNFQSGVLSPAQATPMALAYASQAHDTLERMTGGGSLVLIP